MYALNELANCIFLISSDFARKFSIVIRGRNVCFKIDGCGHGFKHVAGVSKLSPGTGVGNYNHVGKLIRNFRQYEKLDPST